MLGLIVQLTAEFCKIWSTSYHRIITYTRDDLPNGSHEGDWIEIEFNSSGVMKGIKKVEDILETRRDERGKMQVLDIFLVDSQREEAFCETFGVVRIIRRKGGGKWIEERKTRDHCIHLWMTISSNAQFSIEEQSLDRANSKDGKYSEKYMKLLDGFEKIDVRSPRNEISEECREFDETILIVGFDHKSKRFFSSSRCGDAFINESVWSGFNQEIAVEIGTSFHARIEKIEGTLGDTIHRVLKLYEKVALWEGVIVNLSSRDLTVELNAVVMERRQTCFALETEPFGLVTYPLDRNFLPPNLYRGDHMLVALYRYKNEYNSDHPSKWQVTRIVKMLEEPVEESKDEGEWFEGVVTSISNPVDTFITFKHGSARYSKNVNRAPLSLGDIVDIIVKPSKEDGWFYVTKIGSEKMKRKDLIVEPFQKTKCNVFCIAKVIDRCKIYFLLETPIIGLAIFNVREAPQEMEVGDEWRVKMLRRKEKRDSPSYWVATEVVGDCPRVSSEENRRREREDTVVMREREDTVVIREREDTVVRSTNGHSFKRSIPSTPEDIEWTTVLITGSDHGLWYACCARDDPIRIPKKLNRTGKDLERGKFYRIKISFGSDGPSKPHDLDPEEVYPRDIEVETKENQSIKLWCYSRIVDVDESSFTVRNDLIGDATLPFKRASKEMRVGDQLDTLYYRVKATSNPTHWMVEEAYLIRSKINCEDEYGKSEDLKEINSICENNKLSIKDRRVIEIMHKFMGNPEVRTAFLKDPKAIDNIEKILQKDYMGKREQLD